MCYATLSIAAIAMLCCHFPLPPSLCMVEMRWCTRTLAIGSLIQRSQDMHGTQMHAVCLLLPKKKHAETSKRFQTAQTLPASKKCPDPGKSNALGDLEFLSYLIHTHEVIACLSAKAQTCLRGVSVESFDLRDSTMPENKHKKNCSPCRFSNIQFNSIQSWNKLKSWIYGTLLTLLPPSMI